MLAALQDGARVEADRAERGPAYRCPGCRGELILKRGRIVIPHFAHKPLVRCDWARGETLAHLGAKTAFRDLFLGRGLRAEVEYEIPSLAGDRRADVLVWSPNGRPVAIELQHRSIGLDEIERRTNGYRAAGLAVVWIPLIGPKPWRRAERIDAGADGDYFVGRYAARPWERWIHGYNIGLVWYYDPAARRLWRGRLDGHQSYVEITTWFDEHGRERRRGGFYRYSRRWKELTLWGPYDLAELRITLSRRRERRIGHYHFPGGPTARLFVPPRRPA